MPRPAKKREKSSEGSGEAAEERPREPVAKRRRAAEKEAAPEVDEQRERLRRFAVENGLLSLCQASTSAPLQPSKTAIKQDGRDIVKKGARKNRFLFALPGLFAPIAGGKIGELADLHTKKPVLYIDFPQGRMKLFGTIIYPKNKYLTLQLAKTSKSILCEDWFENMVTATFPKYYFTTYLSESQNLMIHWRFMIEGSEKLMCYQHKQHTPDYHIENTTVAVVTLC